MLSVDFMARPIAEFHCRSPSLTIISLTRSSLCGYFEVAHAAPQCSEAHHHVNDRLLVCYRMPTPIYNLQQMSLPLMANRDLLQLPTWMSFTAGLIHNCQTLARLYPSTASGWTGNPKVRGLDPRNMGGELSKRQGVLFTGGRSVQGGTLDYSLFTQI